MGQGGVPLDGSDDVVSEMGIVTCKLVCDGGEDIFEFPSVKVVSGTEEAGTKDSLSGNHF